MRLPYAWLNRFVDTRGLDPNAVAQSLTMIGLEVEHILDGRTGPVFEMYITPNRADALSVRGVARDVAAAYNRPFCPQGRSDTEYLSLAQPVVHKESKISDRFALEIRDPDLCPRYSAMMMEGVRVSPSPAWLTNLVEDAGIRSISNVVDATNFVLMELGQPLHSFDFRFLRGGKIVVRRATHGEKMATLDGIERTFCADDLLICDGEKPVAVAGVMGGLDSEVKDDTNTLLLESAHFHFVSVRRTSKRLGLATESSFRFERRVDPAGTMEALERVCQVICATAGGVVLQGAADILSGDLARRQVTYRPERCNKLLGFSINEEEQLEYLERLGFDWKPEGNAYTVFVPSFRADVEGEHDLIEEVARIHGYDRIGVTIPHSPGIVGGKKYDCRLDQAKEILRAQGFSETLTHSLSSPKLAFGKVTAWNQPFIEISNPVSAEFSCMRTSLLPGLIAFAQQSIAHQEENLAVFEAGRCYYPESQGAGPREEKHLALLATGVALENSLKLPVSQRLVDFLDIKGALSLLSNRLLGEQFELEASEHNLMGKECCAIKWQGQAIGHIGRLRNEVEREIRARHRVYCAEFAFQPLEDWRAPASAYAEAPRYPHSARDIAVVVSSQQKYAEVEACIRKAAGPHFESLELFDVFTGKQLGAGKKSLAFRLIFRRPDGTLTDEAVSGAMDAIQLRLQTELGASIREP